MFCPKCGAEGGTTRFCRSCGTNLAVVSNVLGEDDPSRPLQVAPGNKTTLNLFHSSSLSNENERDLNGHTAVSIFGSTRLDLTAAALATGETNINVISVFGGTEIFVPDDVAIRVTGVSVFGGVKVRGLELSNGIFSQHGYESPGYNRAAKRLHIDATSVFGGTKIKR
jgi:Cell wall-active antibiotics response 4TMS YvqF